MTGEVVEFRKKPTCDAPEDGGGPYLSGVFVCGACSHEWDGVAPVGTTHVDCPNCKRAWGVAKHAVVPEYSWRCNCGERLFWLTPKGAMCRGCGVISSDWAE